MDSAVFIDQCKEIHFPQINFSLIAIARGTNQISSTSIIELTDRKFLKKCNMNVNIWGCRGSIARSHPSLNRYGGNTPCVEVVVEGNAGDGGEDGDEKQVTRIVLDMGR